MSEKEFNALESSIAIGGIAAGVVIVAVGSNVAPIITILGFCTMIMSPLIAAIHFGWRTRNRLSIIQK